MGGLTGGVPFLHSAFFRSYGGDLRLELMACCQSRVSKIRLLKGLWEGLIGSCKEDPLVTLLRAKS